MIGIILSIFAIFILLLNSTHAIALSDNCHECCEHYCFDLDHKKYETRHYGIKTVYPRMKDSQLIKPFAGSGKYINKVHCIFGIFVNKFKISN